MLAGITLAAGMVDSGGPRTAVSTAAVLGVLTAAAWRQSDTDLQLVTFIGRSLVHSFMYSFVILFSFVPFIAVIAFIHCIHSLHSFIAFIHCIHCIHKFHSFIVLTHFIQSFIHSFHLFTHSIHSLIPFIHSFHSFIHSFIHSFHSLIHSFTHFIHSFIPVCIPSPSEALPTLSAGSLGGRLSVVAAAVREGVAATAEAVWSGRRRVLIWTAAVLRVLAAAALQSRTPRQRHVIRAAAVHRVLAAAPCNTHSPVAGEYRVYLHQRSYTALFVAHSSTEPSCNSQ